MTPDEKKAYMKQYRKDNRVRMNEQKLLKTRQKRAINKTKAIELLGGRCYICEKVYPPYVYDFHHMNPSEKEVDPGSLMHKSWESVEKEVSKCILVCANCHRILHYGE